MIDSISYLQVRKTAITSKVLQLVHQLLDKGIHVTKRDLFYTDVKLFRDQSESDTILDDVACMIGCTRSSLHVVASEKGVVVLQMTSKISLSRVCLNRSVALYSVTTAMSLIVHVWVWVVKPFHHTLTALQI